MIYTKSKIILEEVKPWWEACKEPLRLIVLSIIPFALTYLAGVSYAWAIAATIVLRGIDKYLYDDQ